MLTAIAGDVPVLKGGPMRIISRLKRGDNQLIVQCRARNAVVAVEVSISWREKPRRRQKASVTLLANHAEIGVHFAIKLVAVWRECHHFADRERSTRPMQPWPCLSPCFFWRLGWAIVIGSDGKSESVVNARKGFMKSST